MKYYGILQKLWSEYWWEVLEGNLSDDLGVRVPVCMDALWAWIFSELDTL